MSAHDQGAMVLAIVVAVVGGVLAARSGRAPVIAFVMLLCAVVIVSREFYIIAGLRGHLWDRYEAGALSDDYRDGVLFVRGQILRSMGATLAGAIGLVTCSLLLLRGERGARRR